MSLLIGFKELRHAAGRIIRWDEVPPEYRVTRRFLLTRVGASTPGWIERNLARIARADEKAPGQCQAALQWNGEPDVWHPCGIPTAAGEPFCYAHNGLPGFRRRDDTEEALAERRVILTRRIKNLQQQLEYAKRQRDIVVQGLRAIGAERKRLRDTRQG